MYDVIKRRTVSTALQNEISLLSVKSKVKTKVVCLILHYEEL